jgi:methylmalonyl-CoA/ethylmalonyl-CoA epimerase
MAEQTRKRPATPLVTAQDEARAARRDASSPDVTGAVVAGAGLDRIDHVGVAVADLDTAIEFYQRMFGMRCVHIEENAEQGVREAMMSVGPDPADGCVQLLAPLSPGSTLAKFLAKSGPGVQHVAFRVTDLDATSAELRARGVRLLYPAPRPGTAGSRVNFVHPRNAGGVLVELVEPRRPR